MALFLKSFPRHLLTYALYNDIVNQQDRSYYFVAGRTKEWDDGPTSPPAETDDIETLNEVRRNMIVGVKVRASDAAFVIPRNTWTYGTMYTNFSDDEHDTPFFVINSANDIYKVISNNNGATSIVEPTSRTTDSTFRTADGYTWKYISTITPTQMSNFGSIDKIPLIANTTVQSSAVPGTIDAVSVLSVGTLYSKFGSGNVLSQVSNTTIRVNGISDETTDYYANTTLYVTTGEGSGTMTLITGSVSNNSGDYLLVSNTINVDSSSSFLISPQVVFAGDGTGAKAYATGNNNGIESVIVTSPGSGYTYATITIPGTTGVAANCKPFISPLNGHGFNVYSEFEVGAIALNGEFPIAVASTFPDDLTFHQFALLESPKFANNDLATGNTLLMSVKFEPSNGAVFTEGETVYGYASEATGIVYKSNTTATYLCYVTDQFAEDEVVQGLTSSVTSSANNVTTLDYKINSGTILYYSNQTAINRSDTTVSERIRCVFDLEG